MIPSPTPGPLKNPDTRDPLTPAADPSETAPSEPRPRLLERVTAREATILTHLLENRRVPLIARMLQISPNTVRNHLKAVFRKAGVHSQDELLLQLLLERRGRDSPGPAAEETAVLSPRERQIVQDLLAGYRVSSIARLHSVSRSTVYNHLKSAYRKFGVRSQIELIERLRR